MTDHSSLSTITVKTGSSLVGGGDGKTSAKSGDSAESASPPPPIRVIQELYQDYNDIGYKQGLAELDHALTSSCQYIVIEPVRLGDETVRWIQVGNFLHKSTVITGALTSISVALSAHKWHYWAPLAASTALTFTSYTLFWQNDPCCRYQVERNQETLACLDIGSVSTHSVIVLAHRDDQRRRILHTSITVMAACSVMFAAYKLYW